MSLRYSADNKEEEEKITRMQSNEDNNQEMDFAEYENLDIEQCLEKL